MSSFTVLRWQHKDVSKIEHNLNKIFSNICDWFVDNQLSIQFGEDKTKCILFDTKQKLNKTGSLNIKQGTIQIKQHHIVTYLDCVIDENLSWETMGLKVISKISSRLMFLYRKNRFLSQPLRNLSATLWYNLISIMRAQLGIPTWITD